MKKSVKVKIATGVIAASLLGSTGYAFANSNAGSQLKAWGDSQIAAVKQALSKDNSTATTAAVNKFNSDSATKRDNSKKAIDQAGTAEKADREKNIKDKLAEHVASLQAALADYVSTIGGDFDTFVGTEKGKTTKSLNDQLPALTASINSVLQKAQSDNVNSVTEASLLVKGQATSDLIKEINRVKGELQKLVDSEKATAKGELDAHLVSVVTDVNKKIEDLISGLETTAKNEIGKAGKAVEDSAVANFDRVINRLDKETPLVIDPQKIKWEIGAPYNGKIHFKVTNTNEFDVVFKYKFTGLTNTESGVSETPFATSTSKPGVTEFDFSEIDGIFVGGGTLQIQWLDQNGVWQSAGEFGPF
ncbi:hypothetical protein [Bacillus salipaludis]|uniref:Uncharacterized protein n=1 Tax=Bacillus salipaludis TaxID=2547811 RepID=A0ABW8RL83_9BACI